MPHRAKPRNLRVVALLLVGSALALARGTSADELDAAAAAQAHRRNNEPVRAQPDGLIVCEAEEFKVTAAGWEAKNWGSNYYAATFANTFLSRKAYLEAPEQCQRTTASIEVEVPEAGRYLVLTRRHRMSVGSAS